MPGDCRGDGAVPVKAGCCHCQDVRSRVCRSFKRAPAPYPPKRIIWPPMKTAAAPRRGMGGIPSVVGRCQVHVFTSRKCTSFRRFLSAPRPPNTTSLGRKERNEKFTLFSDHNGSLLWQQPRAPAWEAHAQMNAHTSCNK